jgi:3-deoxy-manno-octulosonate cytidylyltransferase (CMP-KDO synthetase)
MKTMKYPSFAGIIPARFASSRFPGKPLARIGSKLMIEMVYEQASKALDNVFVATDDKRITEAVRSFGGKAVMTSPLHQSGTDRCYEALEVIEHDTGLKLEVVINIQGDEPFIKPDQIDLLASCFNDQSVEIATLICKAEESDDLFNPNQIKTVVSINGDALYFSRSPIPYIRDEEMKLWIDKHIYYKHLGLYAYKKETLKKLTTLSRSSLEIAESLEQNRWLENGFRIRTAVTNWDSIGIDTPADLERAKTLLKDFS